MQVRTDLIKGPILMETTASQAVRLLPPPVSTLASMSEGGQTSTFTWVWEKMTSFFRWLFCLKADDQTSSSPYLRDFDGNEVKFRLIVDGKGTENEILLTPSSAALNDIRLPNSKNKEEVGKMLVQAMEDCKIHELTTDDFSNAKFLHDAGLKVAGSLEFNLEAGDADPFLDFYFSTRFKEAFSSKRPTSEEGKLVLQKIEEQVVKGFIGFAFSIDEAARKAYLEASFEAIEHAVPGFNTKEALERIEHEATLTEEIKALLVALKEEENPPSPNLSSSSYLGGWNVLSRRPAALPPVPAVDLTIELPYSMIFELFGAMKVDFQDKLKVPQTLHFILPQKP